MRLKDRFEEESKRFEDQKTNGDEDELSPDPDIDYSHIYGDKPIIYINWFDEKQSQLINKEQHIVGQEAWDILLQSKREIFRKSGVLVSPEPGDHGNIIFKEFDTERMVGLLSEEMVFIKMRPLRGSIVYDVQAIPHKSYATYILKNCDITDLPEATSIVSHPFVYREAIDDPDNIKDWGTYKEYTDDVDQFQYSIVSEPGMHIPTGVYINQNSTVDVRPYDSLEEADTIINDIFKDFPYGDNASLPNTVAQLITGVCRYALGTDMPPISLTTSQTHGSGKTMETDVIHSILYGITADWNPKIKTLDEYRKTLLTNAIAGTPMVCFDNLNEKLDLETLASVATARRLAGRILHTMTNVAVQNYMQICINGTAMDISTEIADRTIWKVMSTHEKTADRDFKYKALIDRQVVPNRKYILSAVFTYVQKWIDAGCPISKVKQNMHRQKVWAGIIGGILQDTRWYDDFLGNTAEQRIQSDSTYVRWSHAMRDLARHIKCEPGAIETFPFTVSEAMPICSYFDYELDEITLKKKVFERDDPDSSDNDLEKYRAPFYGHDQLGEDIGTERKNYQSRSTILGILFRDKSKNNGTPFGSWKIVDAGQYQQRRRFKLVWIGDGDIPNEFLIINHDEFNISESAEDIEDDGINL